MIYIIGLAWCAVFYFPVNLGITQSFFIPCVPYVILAVLHAHRCNRFLAVAQITGISFIYLFVNVFGVTSYMTDTAARLLSGAQLSYSLFCSFTVAFSHPYSPKEKLVVSRSLLVFAAFCCLYGIAEISSPQLANISNVFRNWCYPSELIYGMEDSHLMRDLVISGRLRPYAFASEPSAASWGIMCLCISGYALTSSVKEKIVVLCIVLVSTIVFSSPSNMLGFGLLLLCLFIENRIISKKTLWLYFIWLLVAGWLTYLIAFAVLDSRINLMTANDDMSTFVRLVQPFETALQALKFDLLFGVGFGGLEEIWNSIRVLELNGISSRINMTAGAALLTVPLFGGITGVVLFIVLGVSVYREIAVKQRLVFLSVVLFSMMNKSSIVITLSWFVVAIWIVAHPKFCASSGFRQEE
jgi:hypothetical protein